MAEKIKARAVFKKPEDKSVIISFYAFEVERGIGVTSVYVYYDYGDPENIPEDRLETYLDEYLGIYLVNRFSGCKVIKINDEMGTVLVKII